MTETEYLLTLLMEEAAEIQQAAAKALRFGLDDRPPDSSRPTTNAQEIVGEVDDLRGVIVMLTDRGLIPMSSLQRVIDKQRKVEHFMAYSVERGTLQR